MRSPPTTNPRASACPLPPLPVPSRKPTTEADGSPGEARPPLARANPRRLSTSPCARTRVGAAGARPPPPPRSPPPRETLTPKVEGSSTFGSPRSGSSTKSGSSTGFSPRDRSETVDRPPTPRRDVRVRVLGARRVSLPSRDDDAPRPRRPRTSRKASRGPARTPRPRWNRDAAIDPRPRARRATRGAVETSRRTMVSRTGARASRLADRTNRRTNSNSRSKCRPPGAAGVAPGAAGVGARMGVAPGAVGVAPGARTSAPEAPAPEPPSESLPPRAPPRARPAPSRFPR